MARAAAGHRAAAKRGAACLWTGEALHPDGASLNGDARVRNAQLVFYSMMWCAI